MYRIVFITGGIGSGKSLVCSFLASRGVPVYDSDAAVKDLYDRSPELVTAVGAVVGVPLTGQDGRLDRKALAKAVFADKALLEEVEAIVHPAVLDDFMRWRESVKGEWCGFGKMPFVVMESALVLEKPLFDGVADRVVLVDAPESVRVARAMVRDGVSEEAVRARIASQPAGNRHVDAVIVNDGSVEALEAEVERVFADLF